jgi:hypothetical protein
MSLRKRFSHLEKLDDLQPDSLWENKAKYQMLAEISSQNRLMQAQKITSSDKADILFMNFLSKVSPSFSKVVAFVLIIMMGSGVGYAAQASVPGETLWPIKRSMEKVELTLAVNPIKETEVHIKHVGKRVKEIDKILQADNTQTVKKEKAIKQAVSHLEKDVNSVDGSLKVVMEEKNPTEIVTLVQKVTEASQEVKTNLKASQESNVNDQVINKALEDAAQASDKVKDSAVSLALEVHQEVAAANDAQISANANSTVSSTANSVAISKASSQEAATVKAVVTQIIVSEIKNLSQEINDTQAKVDNVKTEDLNVLSAKETKIDSASKIIADISVVKETSVAATVALDQAKVLVKEGSLKDALDKVSESKEIKNQADVILDKLQVVAQEKALVDANASSTASTLNNTTSTPKIIGTSTPKVISTSSPKLLEGENNVDLTGVEVKLEDFYNINKESQEVEPIAN